MRCHPSRARVAARLLVLAVAFLPSCDWIEHPLTEPDRALPDERLYGAWKYMPCEPDGTRYWYVFIGRSDEFAPSGIMKAVQVGDDKYHKMQNQTLYFFQASVGSANYAHVIANATQSPDGFLQWDRSSSQYVLVKYALEKDQLCFWLMDLKAATTAVTKRQLKGSITDIGILKLIQISETGQGLSRFLAGGGDQVLFPEANKLRFVKIK